MKTNYVGQIFGRLEVIDYSHTSYRKSHWICVCNCGNMTIVMSSHLTCGRIRSCGCLKKEDVSARFYKHGMTNSKEYVCWGGMKYRCFNSKSKHYSDYGGRGISVCDRWVNSFKTFLKDMGRMPKNMNSVDRIDVNGNYEPSNCRWGDSDIQSRNKRNNIWIEYKGLKMIAIDWANYLGVNQGNFYIMLKRKAFSEIFSFYLKKHGSLPYPGSFKNNEK